MESKDYCKLLVNGLSFHQHNVRFCTTNQTGPIVSEYGETPKELVKKILQIKKEAASKIPDECTNCIYKDETSIVTDKITRIDLFYWYHCNCRCFYCTYRDETKGEYSDKVKYGNPKIYETIKELYKANKIDNSNLEVIFGGGEIGVLKEFPKLIDLFLKHDVHNIWCETSGIKHLRALDKVLKKGKGGLTVAVCAGSADVYKKIKQRDKYKQVMSTLKKYVKATKKHKQNPNNLERVISKFIILEGFNNNREEIDKWLNEGVKAGLKYFEISMEFCWGTKTKAGKKVEDYNYELFDYAENKCRELGVILHKNATSLALMKKGTY